MIGFLEFLAAAAAGGILGGLAVALVLGWLFVREVGRAMTAPLRQEDAPAAAAAAGTQGTPSATPPAPTYIDLEDARAVHQFVAKLRGELGPEVEVRERGAHFMGYPPAAAAANDGSTRPPCAFCARVRSFFDRSRLKTVKRGTTAASRASRTSGSYHVSGEVETTVKSRQIAS